MANPVWPSTLPRPDYGWSEGEVDSEFIRSQPDAGVAKQRPRYTAVAIPITATLTLTPAQVSTLKSFFAIDCKRTLPFDWTDMLNDSGTVTYRFTKRPTYSRTSYGQVTVGLALERMPTGYDGTGNAPPPGVATPPSNTVAPFASGSLEVGGTLQCSSGTWVGSPPPSLTYQWQSWTGSAWAVIAGATANSYVTTSANSYRCVVTGTNIGGALAAASNTLVVTQGSTLPANTVAPSISGNLPAGNLMTANPGTWTGYPAPGYAYQWQQFVGGVWANISGATASTYTTTSAGSLRVMVIATNAAGSTSALSPSITISPPYAAPVNTTLPVISGTLVQGNQIECSTGTWSANPAATYSYQWQSFSGSWSNIVGETLYTYTPASAGTYRCNVTATNSEGSGMVSSPSVEVASTASTVPSAPIIGSATRGNALAIVSFTPPVSDGGSTITSYVVTSSPGGISASGLASPVTVPGLNNGTAYTFTVKAINAVGESIASAASNSVTPATVPGAPTSVTAVEGQGQATISFVAPVDNGGSDITSYTVVSSPGGHAVTGNNSPLIVTGLSNGTAYTFTARATNDVGNSASSAVSNSVTPKTVPEAPTIGVLTATGDGTASIAFTPGGNGGSAITGYTAVTSPGGITASGSSSPIELTGLTNGVEYTVRVYATNAIGDGALSLSSNTATTTAVPDAPTIGVATAGNTSASVAFTPPADNGGSPITQYTVTSTPGGITSTGTASPIEVSGLTNGVAYTFTVKATTLIGDSVQSAASNSVIPKAVPSAPAIVSAVAGNGQVTVSFTAPSSDGGSAITQYTVVASPGGAQFSDVGSPIIVTGLANGTPYTFTVYATNAAGDGTSSAPSAAVTPSTVPSAPTIGIATVSGIEAASVAFTPNGNGGSDITSYEVTSSPDSIVATGASSPIVVPGLTTNTAYTFTVKAINANGSSVASAASNSITAANVPDAPTIGTATAGDGEVTLTWTAGADNSSAITEFRIYNGGTFVKSAPSSPDTITGLINGESYLLTVTAVNAMGESIESDISNTVIPSGVPQAPEIIDAIRGDGQVSISYAASDPNGSSITSYTVTSSPGGFTAVGLGNPLIVTGLSNGTAYTFTMTATNANGVSSVSNTSPSVTPATVPGAPTIGAATGGDAQASVAFTAPASNGGSAITSYTVIASPGGATASGTVSPIVVTGLQNGVAHTFTVTATNAVGTSAASAASNSVTPIQSTTVPGAPTIGSVSRGGSGQVIVAFTPPGNNGGSAITGYTVTSNPGGLTGTGTSSPITVSGLTNGTNYTFTVHATNSSGDGPESAPSASISPASVPGAPGQPVATATGVTGEVKLNFSAAAANGSSITSYTATSSPGGITRTATAVELASGPLIVGGLANGVEYTFTITATNSLGTGPASPASNAITLGSSTTGPYDAFYDPSWTPIIGKTLLSMQAESLPAVSADTSVAGYIDSRYGTRIYRPASTDSGTFAGVGKVRHQYARQCPFNADGTRFYMIGGSRLYLFDAETFDYIPGGRSGTPSAIGSDSASPQGSNDISWDATNPDVLYFSTGGLVYYEYNVVTQITSTYFNLASALSAVGMGSATVADTGGEGRPSDDGRYWCLWVRNGSTTLGYVVADFVNKTIVGSMLTSVGVNNVSMSSLGNYAILANSSSSNFATCAASSTLRGTRAYSRDFSTFNQLHCTSNHADPCIDMDGDEAFVAMATANFDQLPFGDAFVRKCSGGLPIKLYNKGENTSNQQHMSGCAAPGRPGWAIISTYHETSGTEDGWGDQGVFAVKLANPTEIRRIAHYRGSPLNGSYWDEPQATCSRDGLSVIFASRFRLSSGGALALTDQESFIAGLPSWFYGGSAPPPTDPQDPPPDVGTSLISNGDFQLGGANWTMVTGSGWSFVGGGAVFSPGVSSNLHQSIAGMRVGDEYRIQFEITAYSAGTISPRLGNGTGISVDGASVSGIGTHETFLTLNSTSGFTGMYFRAFSTFNGTIDNVILERTKRNLAANPSFDDTTIWTLGTGWSIASGSASHVAGTSSSLSQPITLEVGADYQITFNISSYTAGNAIVRLSGGTNVDSVDQNGVGTKTVTLTAVTGNNTVNIHGYSDFVGTIDNVIVLKLAAVASVPDAPTIGTATPGDTNATVTFTPPVDNGGAAISGYTVTASPGGLTGTGSASPIVVSGLTNYTAYTFTVTATNSVGTSAASAASNSAIPFSSTNLIGNGTFADATGWTLGTGASVSGGQLVLNGTANISCTYNLSGLSAGTYQLTHEVVSNAFGNVSNQLNSVNDGTLLGTPSQSTGTVTETYVVTSEPTFARIRTTTVTGQIDAVVDNVVLIRIA